MTKHKGGENFAKVKKQPFEPTHFISTLYISKQGFQLTKTDAWNKVLTSMDIFRTVSVRKR